MACVVHRFTIHTCYINRNDTFSKICLQRVTKTQLAFIGTQCRHNNRFDLSSHRHYNIFYKLIMEHNHDIKQEDNLQLDQLEKVIDNHTEHEHSENDGHDHGEEDEGWKAHSEVLIAFAILIILLVLQYGFKVRISHIPSLIINAIAWLLAGRKVADLAFRKSKRGDFFNEFVLMTVATIGAFLIGAYEEGVAVMVFYSIGEWFQDAAVDKAKRNIKALLDIRPDAVTVLRNGKPEVTDPSKVQLGES